MGNACHRAPTLGTTHLSGTGTVDFSNDTLSIAAGGCTLDAVTTKVNLASATLNGPGTLTNAAGGTLTLVNTIVNAPLVNQGILISHGSTSDITGAFTTATGSTINLTSDDVAGYAYLTVANSFTNNGTIILANNSANGYTSVLSDTSGQVVNTGTGAITASGASNASVQPDTINGLSNLGGKLTLAGKWVLKVTGPVTLGNTSLLGTGTLDLTNDAISIPASGATFASGLASMNLNSATIGGPGTLTNAPGSNLVLVNTVINTDLVNQGLLISHGTTSDILGTYTAASGSTINLTSDDVAGYAYLTFGKSFTNNATIIMANNSLNGYTSALAMSAGATLTNSAAGSITASGAKNASVQPDVITGSFANLGGNITVAGTWVLKINGSVTLGNTALLGTGTLDLSSDTLSIPAGGATFASGLVSMNLNSATLNGPGILTNAPGSTLTLYNTVVNAPLVNQGILVSHGTTSDITGAFTTAGGSTINLTSDDVAGYAYLTVANSFTNNGTIIMANTSANGYTSALTLSSGTLTNAVGATILSRGSSSASPQPNTITATVANAGTLAVSFATTLNGKYSQASTGTYAFTLGSPSATILGAATLSGLLDLYLPTGFKLTLGQSYPVMSYPSHSGDFTALDGNNVVGFALSKVPGATTYSVKAGPAPADTTAPTISAFTPSVPVAGAATYTFAITFTDNLSLDVSTLSSTNVKVTGPNGFSQFATLDHVSKSNDGAVRTAVYSIVPTGGKITLANNGTYTATLQPASVKDTHGNAVAGKVAGTFTINILPALSGTVFNDLNANGVKETGEAGLAGIKVYLDKNNNGKLDAGEVFATTDATGKYLFATLTPGTYIVREVLPAGYRLDSPTTGFSSVNVTAAGGATANFADTQKALISGTVFNDLNGNKLLDATEKGVSGVRVYIDANKDGVFQSTEANVLTDANGNWSFGNLAAGTYVVRIVLPAGKTLTTPTGGAFTVTVAAAATSTGKLFGEK